MNTNSKIINVTKTYLPPLQEYISYLEKLWVSGWITNDGELVKELEKQLTEYLNVPHIQYVANGTTALQIALQALDIQGEVITTPFSYVATTNAILWERCTPVFADIDPLTFCIDPIKIEPLITERTKAIVGVHVYGYPCDVKAIERIAEVHNLRVIYDAAHAFGCKLNGESLLNYGDLSILSFHATKMFHTVEGGALVAPSAEIANKIYKIKSFGHVGDEYFMLGVNGKNSEFHAAMGLCILPHILNITRNRQVICQTYVAELSDLNIVFSNLPEGFEYNHAYFPILLRDEAELLVIKEVLNSHQINPRRYFYPSLNTLPFLQSRQSCPVSEDISLRVLCLPLYEGLEMQDVYRIVTLIRDTLIPYRKQHSAPIHHLGNS